MNPGQTSTIRVIDSHTEGEPTRVIMDGGPDLGTGTVAERLVVFRDRFDRVRSAVVNEPRGSDPVVGALLCAPSDAAASIGVIFFNNVGFLGMCGHGTIGVMATLAHLGRIGPGAHVIETPVGNVTATLHADGSVSVANVASYRARKGVAVQVPGLGTNGTIHGDVAWGGNWFFLCDDHGVPMQPRTPEILDRLLAAAGAIRRELARQGIRGTSGEEVDHVELFGEPGNPANHSRNFVLCPGGAYDRSPCGTGVSAKLACLAGDGKLLPGEEFRQESIIGSVFSARYTLEAAPCGASQNPRVLPVITGRAFVTADATLILDPRDPFVHGIRL